MRRSIALTTLTLAAALAACTGNPAGDAAENGDPSEVANPTSGPIPGAIPVEPDGGIGDGAGPPDAPSTGGEMPPSNTGSTSAQESFPAAIRGTWRATDGASVSRAQCDGTVSANMGKVLTIREASYSYFEQGGRFVEVVAREPGRIRAVFDTTYADEPTRDELEFRVDPVAKTLTVRNFDTGEEMTTTYRRCPQG